MDALEYMNEAMTRPSPEIPPPHHHWEKRIAALCEKLEEKDAEIKTWKEVDKANTDAIKRLTACLHF
jgi:hypothetical protein